VTEVVGKWQKPVPYFDQYRATFNAAFVNRSPAPYTGLSGGAVRSHSGKIMGMSQNRIGKRHTGNGIEETFRHPVWHSATE